MKNIKLWISLCILLLAAGIIGSAWMINTPHSSWVEIIQDGNVLYSFDLSKTEDQILEIEYKGKINTVKIENQKIWIIKADCPDQTCINMGKLESSAFPIVCLPNHLVIQFSKVDNKVDVIAN